MAEPLVGHDESGSWETAGISSARTMAHGEILARWGRSRPDKVAFVCGERSVTYAEMDRRANAVANAFAGGGWPRGTGWACSWATTSSMSRSCSGRSASARWPCPSASGWPRPRLPS